MKFYHIRWRLKTKEKIICTCQTLLNRLKEFGINTERHILYNEILDAYKEKYIGNGIKYKLVPSVMHHRNLSEIGIQKIQMTFQVITMWSGWLVPTQPVGHNHPTNRNVSELTTSGKRDTKSIRICVPQQTKWFQVHSNSTIGVHRPKPQ